MRLLISVRDEMEAAAAMTGGADIVDAKNPNDGPLGAVSLEVMHQISRIVGGARTITAALGDASDQQDIEREAAAFAAAGAQFVKIGFSRIADMDRIHALIAAAGEGVDTRVVAVAYADYRYAETASPETILEAAIGAGAAGILIDTADKSGPGLFALMSTRAIQQIVASARRAGLLAALAGRLSADDLPLVRDTGADIAGVRGAACDDGRTGRISAGRVAHLRQLLTNHAGDSMADDRPPIRAMAAANSSAPTIVGTMCDGTARSK